MKKWECTVCGYIHEGDEPPKECPVCGAGPEYFKEVVATEDAEAAIQVAETPVSVSEPAADGDSDSTGGKKWECTVCGYIHEGDEPPKECPVCGAGSEFVKEIGVTETPKSSPTIVAPEAVSPVSPQETAANPSTGSVRKWECTLCGYIHEGDEPPKQCPVCGAGPEYFKEIVEKEAETLTEAALAPESAKENSGFAAIRAQVMKHHLHPISVHTPNGVLPVALVFLALSIVFGVSGFEKAAFFNLVFVLLTMPFVIATGVIAWQERYKGAMTKIFGVKIGATIVVCSTLLAMIVWRLVDPAVATSPGRWTYLIICLVSVAGAGLAGHMGGKLVFGGRSK